jgi:hypothetical protein
LFPMISHGDVAFGFNWWASRWTSRTFNRGKLDMNFGYDDGSVRRLTGVPSWNVADNQTPVDRLPLQYDGRRGPVTDRFSVPRQ